MAFSFRNKDVYINAQKSENAPVPTAAVLPIQTVVPSETAFDEEMHTLEVSAERASEIVAGGTGSEQPIVTSPYMSAEQVNEYVANVLKTYFPLPSKQIAAERITLGHNRLPVSYMADEQLKGLASDMYANSLLEPILVVPIDSGKFEIVAGYNRFKAAEDILRWDEIPCKVGNREVLTDEVQKMIAAITNLFRADSMTFGELFRSFTALQLYEPREKLIALFHLSESEVNRLAELSVLNPELMEYVGSCIAADIALKLRELSNEQQRDLAQALSRNQTEITELKAARICRYADKNTLSAQGLNDVLNGSVVPPKVNLSGDFRSRTFAGYDEYESVEITMAAITEFMEAHTDDEIRHTIYPHF